jgi:hypothetical protein
MRAACIAPHKVAHKDRDAALKAIRSLYAAGRGNPDYNAYRCPAGHWHVGHDRVRLDRRIRKALRKGRA